MYLQRDYAMKTRTWLLLLGSLFVVLLVLTLLLFANAPAVATAEVYSDGKLVRTVDLSAEQRFTVEVNGGYNVITVHDGRISVTEASCRNHACIACGERNGGAPIICLPNRLVIQFQRKTELDAVVG